MINGPVVVKIGGHEVDDRAWLAGLASALPVAGRGRVLVVHGGGKEISELQRALGVEPEWREGLRYTSVESMRAVRMALSGLVNKRIVAALLDAGRDAIGVSGEDGGLLRAEFADRAGLGRVGRIVEVRVGLLEALLATGAVPVVSPVARGEDGGPLNVNADDAAAAVAAAVAAAELLLVSNVAGVLKGSQRLAAVAAEEVEPLIAAGVASAGMAPKLRAAVRALAGGVGAVRIGDRSMLVDACAGTRIRPTGHAVAGA